MIIICYILLTYLISVANQVSLSCTILVPYINTTNLPGLKRWGSGALRKFVNPGNRAILQTTQNWTSELTMAVKGDERRGNLVYMASPRNFDESPIDAGETENE